MVSCTRHGRVGVCVAVKKRATPRALAVAFLLNIIRDGTMAIKLATFPNTGSTQWHFENNMIRYMGILLQSMAISQDGSHYLNEHVHWMWRQFYDDAVCRGRNGQH
jgi:hypothetical protein